MPDLSGLLDVPVFRSIHAFLGWLAIVAAIWQPVLELPLLPIVDLGYATYGGVILGDQHVYLGMRYVKAPIGERRWRAPEYPPENVSRHGIIDASRFGSSCHPIYNPLIVPGNSEDCLFASVWTPAVRAPGELLPVLFWIHGGGYIAGSSSQYPGTNLVTASGNNMVVVSINYRLAQFGFLASQEIREDGDLNAGLLDQYAALQWVKDHISKFGGDPAKVSIWGESAGGGSVAMQLLAYGGTNNFFRAAIADSIFFPFQPNASDPFVQNQFDTFASLAGCGDRANGTLECMRKQDENVLLLAGRLTGQTNPSMFAYTPVVDGDFLRDYPIAAFRRGEFRKVPTLIGYNTNEGTSFATPFLSKYTAPSLDQYLRYQFPNITAATLARIYELYPPSAYNESLAYNSSTLFGRAAAIYGEAVFICETPLIGSAQATAGERSYSYRFNRTNEGLPDGFGTPHGDELGFFFGWSAGLPNSPTWDLARSMQAYLTSFVRTLDPNTFKMSTDAIWPVTGVDGDHQLLLEEGNIKPERLPRDLLKRCRFWWGKTKEMQY